MGLSSDLLSQFVKVTNDNVEKNEATNVYGTVTDAGDRKYVQFDGSNTTTPVSTTVDVSEGDRVIVMIKNHSAVITGNLNDPSASSSSTSDTSNQITDLGVAVADRVTTDQLNAMKVTITQEFTANDATIRDTLNASIVSVENRLTAADATITGKVEANAADITDLQTNKLSAEDARLTYATIENLDSTNTTVNNLAGTHAAFENATADNFTAVNADIESLETDKLDADTADITYAKIEALDAAKTDIATLNAEVADIDTLIFGSATGTTIQTSFANAVIAQLGNAQIKSAMIDSISADKVTSGSIVTDNVTIKSSDGKMLISDETIQISDDTRVRVQIGKDADGDYSINIWDQDGNLMFSEGGITDAAIKDAIIRNDMVASNADIHASKLDIDSLFEEINGSTNTIKSTRIYLDAEAQTLDVAFESLSSTVTEQGETISSQGTSISTIQGQISSKIWQQDIEDAKSELQGDNSSLSTQYSELEQELNSISATVASHTSEIANKADSSTVTEVTNRVTSLETDLDGFKTTVSETYVTNTEVEDKFDNYLTTTEVQSAIEQKADSITSSVSSTYATIEAVEMAQSTADEAGEVAFNAETLVKQLSDSISMLVTDGNGTSLMTQTDEGWTFSTADIMTAVNDTSQGLNDLTQELGDTNSVVTVLQQTVDDLGTIADYVKINTYEDEPCIELGEGDSDFKLRITNTRMIFTEGSSVLAYFNNQSLHIKKAVVEEELQQGGFVWKVRSNGNLGLVWKGGNS